MNTAYDLHIRRFQFRDTDEVWRLHLAGLEQMGADAGRGPWDDDLRDVEQTYLHTGDFLVGEVEGELVAMCALKRDHDGLAELKRLRVAQAHQRRGYGETIARTVVARARELGFHALLADTTTRQAPARRLLEKLGFRETHRRRLGELELVFYRLRLDQAGPAALFDRAVDPLQYDATDVEWSAGDGETAREAFFWSVLAPLADTWRGRRVLDVGAGTGWLLDRIEAAGASVVQGIEPSTRNVAAGRRRGRNLVCCQLEEFEPEAPFDVVLMLMVLSHVRDPEVAFRRAHCLLVPGGELQAVIEPYSEESRLWEIDRVRLRPGEDVILLDHPRGPIADVLRTPEMYVKAAAQAALEILERTLVEGRTGIPPFELLRFRRRA